MSITNKLTYLEQTKEGIKQAIINKGVDVSDSDTFRSYIDKIDSITTGGGSSDCVTSVCFDEIGYTTTPQYMIDGVAYAKQIKDTWDASATSRKFTNDLNLVYFPQVDVSNITAATDMFSGCRLLQYVPSLNISSKVISLYAMFYDCNSLASIDLSEWGTSNVTNMGSMFVNCESLTSLDLSDWDTSNLTNMDYIFSTCKSLVSVDLSGWDTSKVRNMGPLFPNCTKLEKVDGILDLTSCNYSNSYSYFPGYGKLSKLRKLTFKNLGYQTAKTGVDFSYIENWGVNNDTITDAKQSLTDSLVTYTFDRATAGYSTHTITLSTNTKAVLTEEEIAQITAKGYTIA